jgi:regulation of enolase protein 1 (concanavalin A-like superfamily)
VWGTSDQFQYAYRSLTGDGTIVARVTSIQNVNAWVKAGVMIRNSLSPSAAHGFMLVAASAAKGVPFQRRPSDGGASVSTPGSQNTAPRWVKLVRAGNMLTGYESPDGNTWTVVASDTFSMGSTVLVGLAVSSHVTGVTATATFDNVTITSSTPPANTPPSVSLTSPGPGASFAAPATIALAATAGDSDGTIAKVDFFRGTTLLGTDTSAPYQLTWSNVPAGSYTLSAVATDDDGASTASAPVNVTVTTTPPPGGLPSGWSAADVGATGATGGSTFSNGVYSITGAGADVWGTADAFQYAYRSLTGDGTIVARVTSIQNVNAWVKAGVMIRSSLSASSAHGFMLVAASATKGVPFQRRTADGAASVSTPGSANTAPRWVRLVRSGNRITGYESANGVNWTQVGSDTFAMGSTVLVGLAVSSHVSGVTATATFDNVTITGGTSSASNELPSGWTQGDIGAVAVAGNATFSDGAYTVTGSGADVWGTADAFHFAYRPVTGDSSIVARVVSVPQVADPWVKAGVMIRASLDADSQHAFMLASAARGMAFQRRPAAGGESTHTAGSASTAPRWVKLAREGDTFSAYESDNGTTWTRVDADSIPMPPTVYVGLAVTSHDADVSATSVLDSVEIQ